MVFCLLHKARQGFIAGNCVKEETREYQKIMRAPIQEEADGVPEVCHWVVTSGECALLSGKIGWKVAVQLEYEVLRLNQVEIWLIINPSAEQSG